MVRCGMRKILVWLLAAVLDGTDRVFVTLEGFFAAVDDLRNRSAHAAGRHLTYSYGCEECTVKRSADMKATAERSIQHMQAHLDAQREVRAQRVAAGQDFGSSL